VTCSRWLSTNVYRLPAERRNTLAVSERLSDNPVLRSEAESANGIEINDNRATKDSGVFIKQIRIRHFRCFRSIDVELDSLTVRIRQNNAGKTSFLNALFAATGAGQRIISNDDIYQRINDPPAIRISRRFKDGSRYVD
jgi:hypothetical protein